VHGALASRDPGNIADTIAALQRERVRVSVVSLPGEVYVAQRVARETGGAYGVPENFDALRALVLAHCQPPPRRRDDAEGDAEARRMVHVGFPELAEEQPGICSCHKVMSPRAFVCPRCRTRCCEIPSECAVCRLYLVSAPALARSYHHIFPVPRFAELAAAPPGQVECAGCLEALPAAAAPVQRCPECGLVFCAPCGDVIHDAQTCPGVRTLHN
jgi:transcription initiation factor TFIIH subunit 2